MVYGLWWWCRLQGEALRLLKEQKKEKAEIQAGVAALNAAKAALSEVRTLRVADSVRVPIQAEAAGTIVGGLPQTSEQTIDYKKVNFTLTCGRRRRR